MRRAAISATVALLVAIGAGCGSAGQVTAPEPASKALLTRSANASAQAGTARFELTMSMTVPGETDPVDFKASGVLDSAAQRTSFSMDMSALAGKGAIPEGTDMSFDVVMAGTTMYMRIPVAEGNLPAGTWVKADLEAMARNAGIDLSQVSQSEPRQTLDYLRATAGAVVSLGHEDVRGTDTIHYKTTIDLLAYPKLASASERTRVAVAMERLVGELGLRYLPVDVWLDDDDLVRRMDLRMRPPAGGLEMSMRFEMFDYGSSVSIDLPPADKVVPFSALAG